MCWRQAVSDASQLLCTGTTVPTVLSNVPCAVLTRVLRSPGGEDRLLRVWDTRLNGKGKQPTREGGAMSGADAAHRAMYCPVLTEQS